MQPDEQRIARAARGGGLGARARPRAIDHDASRIEIEDARAERRARIGERRRERPFVVDERDDVAGGDAPRAARARGRRSTG